MAERVFAKALQNFSRSYEDAEVQPEVMVRDWSVRLEAKPKVVESEEVNLFLVEPRELMMYFYNRYKEVHDYEYKFDWVREFAIMKSFKNRFGPESGPMVAHLFDQYKGMWGNQVAGISVFSTGAKWIQDILYAEVQEAAKIKIQKSTDQLKGLMESNEFLDKFSKQ